VLMLVFCSPDEIHGFDRLRVAHLLGCSRQGVLSVAECHLARFPDQCCVLQVATGHFLFTPATGRSHHWFTTYSKYATHYRQLQKASGLQSTSLCDCFATYVYYSRGVHLRSGIWFLNRQYAYGR